MRLFAILLFALPTLCQAQTTRLTAVVNTTFNGSKFVLTDSTIYQYSGSHGGHLVFYSGSYGGWWYSGDCDTAFTYKYDTGAHKYDTANRSICTYDLAGRMLTNVQQMWISTGSPHWQDLQRYAYTYDGAGDVATDSTIEWTITTGWQPNSCSEYTHNAHHDITSATAYYWNPSGHTYVPSSRVTYYLDASTYKADSQLVETYSSTYGWGNYKLYRFTYDGSGNMLTDTEYTAAPPYYLTSLTMYTYSGGDVTTETHLNWNLGTLTYDNNEMYTYIHDAKHNVLSRIHKYWMSGAYVNSTKDSTVYNSHNQPINYRLYDWDAFTHFWLPPPVTTTATNDRYYYGPDVAVANIRTPMLKLGLYPNPATNIINVDLKWENAQQAVIAIYDMNGRLFMQWQTEKTDNYHSSIPVSQLPAGNYLLHVKGEHTNTTEQFTVVH